MACVGVSAPSKPARLRAISSSSRRDPRARSRVAEALGADRDERRARVEQIARVTAALDAAHADDGIATRAATARDLRERDRADGRARQAAGAAAQPRRAGAVAGAAPYARSVLISDTASAPAASRGLRDGGDVGGVRRELDDQRLGRQRAHLARAARPSSPGSAPMSRPVSTFGQETLSSSAATSSRSSTRLDQRGDLARGRAHDVGDQRDRQPRELGQVLLEVAAQALVGQADRVDQPGRRSHSRGGGLPSRGSSVIVLETKAANGNALEQRVAERAPRGDRVERARAVDDRVRELEAAEVDRALNAPAPPRSVERAVEHRARRRTGAGSRRRAVGTTQPKQAPKPHAMPGLERELGGTSRAGAQRPHRLEHRRRAAGVDDGVRRRRRARSASRSVTRPWWPTRAVVGGDARRRAAARRPRRGAASRKPSSAGAGAPRRAARPARSPAARCPTPPPHEQRAAAVAAARAKPRPSGPSDAAARRRRRSSHRRAVPGPDVLEHELAGAPSLARAGPRTRAAGTGARPSPPPQRSRRGEHVELARARRPGRRGRRAASTT